MTWGEHPGLSSRPSIQSRGREAEGNWMHTEEEKPNGGRDWSDVATSEGLLAPVPWML